MRDQWKNAPFTALYVVCVYFGFRHSPFWMIFVLGGALLALMFFLNRGKTREDLKSSRGAALQFSGLTLAAGMLFGVGWAVGLMFGHA